MTVHENGTDREPRFEAESTLNIQLPDNRHATISKMDFAVIKDGESAGPKATRDLCLGIAITALLGLVGYIAAVDWSAKTKAGEILPFILATLQGAVFLAFGGLTVFFQRQLKRLRKLSAYGTLIGRLENHFSSTQESRLVAADTQDYNV